MRVVLEFTVAAEGLSLGRIVTADEGVRIRLSGSSRRRYRSKDPADGDGPDCERNRSVR